MIEEDNNIVEVFAGKCNQISKANIIIRPLQGFQLGDPGTDFDSAFVVSELKNINGVLVFKKKNTEKTELNAVSGGPPDSDETEEYEVRFENTILYNFIFGGIARFTHPYITMNVSDGEPIVIYAVDDYDDLAGINILEARQFIIITKTFYRVTSFYVQKSKSYHLW